MPEEDEEVEEVEEIEDLSILGMGLGGLGELGIAKVSKGCMIIRLRWFIILSLKESLKPSRFMDN